MSKGDRRGQFARVLLGGELFDGYGEERGVRRVLSTIAVRSPHRFCHQVPRMAEPSPPTVMGNVSRMLSMR